MNPEVDRPESMPPGVRSVIYEIFCWLNRHPLAWRTFGWFLRRWPAISHVLPFAARRSAVQQVLSRPRSFSNKSHSSNLIAGDFMIGMDPGKNYDSDRNLIDSILVELEGTIQRDADAEAQARIQQIRDAAPSTSFELIDDYLMWVVLAAIKPAFGSAADEIISARAGVTPDEETVRNYLLEIRHVAGHLLGGRLAPLHRRQRAGVSAESLKSRIKLAAHQLHLAWPSSTPGLQTRRNGVGLAWVSHPVTAQSGALAFQELLGRPDRYAALRKEARRLGPQVWTDTTFREEVRKHVLELMRFRPIFPLLARDVPRATEYESGARTNARCPAGSSLTILSISASFDPYRAEDPGKFCPHREWSQPDMQYIMFGYGDRRCPARELAATMLTSAFIGLMTLPELRWANRWGKRITYDGPIISHMPLRQTGKP